MPIKSLLNGFAVGTACVSVLIALMALWHESLSTVDAHMFVHGLEDWVIGTGYHTALIVLAAAAVLYLTHKR